MMHLANILYLKSHHQQIQYLIAVGVFFCNNFKIIHMACQIKVVLLGVDKQSWIIITNMKANMMQINN